MITIMTYSSICTSMKLLLLELKQVSLFEIFDSNFDLNNNTNANILFTFTQLETSNGQNNLFLENEIDRYKLSIF